ncbi:MAG: zinc transporter ZupT, partial [Candidatus Eisenbacteria bacterium]|nr:zinc transporter ZupT [Candidatus Eisenbacteria bacterium]
MIGHGTSEILLALAVTLIAGLATGIGSAIAFFART